VRRVLNSQSKNLFIYLKLSKVYLSKVRHWAYTLFSIRY